jgi:hypothetical protein
MFRSSGYDRDIVRLALPALGSLAAELLMLGRLAGVGARFAGNALERSHG